MDSTVTAHTLIPATEDADTTFALAVSPQFARDRVCFAARNSALYRSNDSGQTWRSCYESLGLEAALTTTSVVVSPNFPADEMVFAGVNGGLLRSINGGASWQIIPLSSPAPFVTVVAASPSFASDGIVFAGTLEDGIFCSVDHGCTWAAWNFGLLDLNVLTLAVSPHFATDRTVLLGTGSGLFRSVNRGRSWRDVALPVEVPAILSLAVVDLATGYVVCVGTESDGIWLSTDGSPWMQVATDQASGSVNALFVDQGSGPEPVLLALVDDTLFSTSDNGRSWAVWPDALSGQQVAAVAADRRCATDRTVLIHDVTGNAWVQSWDVSRTASVA